MTLMHKLLETALRAQGRTRDANEVAAAAEADSPAPRRRSEEEGEDAHALAQPAARIAATPPPQPDHQTGPSSRSDPEASRAGADSARSSATASGNTGLDGELAATPPLSPPPSDRTHSDQEVASGRLAVAELTHAPAPEAPMPDQLDGWAAQHAFRSASADAQDTEIARRAADLLPPELRAILHSPEPAMDISREARAERIAALGGAVPAWAASDPEYNPAVLRSAERTAAGLDARLYTKPSAESAQQPAHESAQPLARQPTHQQEHAAASAHIPAWAQREQDNGREM